MDMRRLSDVKAKCETLPDRGREVEVKNVCETVLSWRVNVKRKS